METPNPNEKRRLLVIKDKTPDGRDFTQLRGAERVTFLALRHMASHQGGSVLLDSMDILAIYGLLFKAEVSETEIEMDVGVHAFLAVLQTHIAIDPDDKDSPWHMTFLQYVACYNLGIIPNTRASTGIISAVKTLMGTRSPAILESFNEEVKESEAKIKELVVEGMKNEDFFQAPTFSIEGDNKFKTYDIDAPTPTLQPKPSPKPEAVKESKLTGNYFNQTANYQYKN